MNTHVAARTWRSAVPDRIAGPTAMAALVVLLAVAAILAIGSGAFSIKPGEVLSILGSKLGLPLDGFTPQQEAVLMGIRLPRVILGIAAGAGLAVAGALLQGLFRNPLADPVLIGVSGGAAFAVASVIVLGATTLAGLSKALGVWTLPVAGFAGGLGATAILYRFSQRDGRTVLATMLLAGIAINALAFAGIGFYSFIATDEQLRNLTFWNFGSLGGATWSVVTVVGPVILVGIVLAWRAAPALNALLLGEREAKHLGYDVQFVKRAAITLAALLAGFLVAVSGVIGFVALVAPHMVRLATGPDHRWLVPNAALAGAVLMLIADIVARTVVAPAELPIGVLTAVLGVPFFLALLAREKARLE